MSMENKRISGLDWIRIIAIFLVVLTHASEYGVYWIDPEHLNAGSVIDRSFAYMFCTVCGCCVPFFFFLTGYLMLGRTYDTEGIRKFWKTKWLHLLLLSQVWFLVYGLFIKLYMKTPDFTWKSVIKSVLFLQRFYSQQDMIFTHAWYMLEIIGLYLLIPFVAIAIAKYREVILFPVVFFYVTLLLVPTLAMVYKFFDEASSLTMQIGRGYSGGASGLYIVTGQMVRIYEEKLKKVRSSVWALGVLFFGVLTYVLQVFAYRNNIKYNSMYDSAIVYLMSLCFFIVLLRIKTERFSRARNFLASNAFGVYLVHMPFKYILLPHITNLAIPRPAQVCVFWLLLMIISYLLVFLIRKIPRVGNWLVYTHA